MRKSRIALLLCVIMVSLAITGSYKVYAEEEQNPDASPSIIEEVIEEQEIQPSTVSEEQNNESQPSTVSEGENLEDSSSTGNESSGETEELENTEPETGSDEGTGEPESTEPETGSDEGTGEPENTEPGTGSSEETGSSEGTDNPESTESEPEEAGETEGTEPETGGNVSDNGIDENLKPEEGGESKEPENIESETNGSISGNGVDKDLEEEPKEKESVSENGIDKDLEEEPKEKESVSENGIGKTETVSENGVDSKEDIEADSSFYYICGSIKSEGECFSSDIEIYPTGKDGYDYIRCGTEGEFSEYIVIREDAIKETILLQFSNREDVTQATELTYSRDTVKPIVKEIISEEQTVFENIICLSTPLLTVKAEDGVFEKEDGTKVQGIGIEAIYYEYDGVQQKAETKNNIANITLPESFFGEVEIWCRDKAGNISEIYKATYLTDVSKYKISLSTKKSVSELGYNEVMVEITDAGVSGNSIEEVSYILDGEDVILEKDSLDKKQLTSEQGVDAGFIDVYYFILEVEKEQQELQVSIKDGFGNTEQETFVISKEPAAELYKIDLPQMIKIMVDPYQIEDSYQIYSANNMIGNRNSFPIKVTVLTQYIINNPELAEDSDSCELSFAIEEKEVSEQLQKGEQTVLEFYMEPDEEADMKFIGSVAEGTEDLWETGDIGLKLSFKFENIRGLIVSKKN